MKITMPELVVLPSEGFSDEKDIFKRKAFGERLANLIENADDNLVLALDSQWGEGKSTFIKMWRGYVEHQRPEKFKTVYFDAFANDYQKDPFLALASEIYEVLPEDNDSNKSKFKEKAGAVAKALTRGAIKIGVKAATGGFVDGSVVDFAEKDIAKLVSDQIDSVIADRFESTTKDRLAITNFKDHLELVAKEQGNGKPLVFIIDELDRCRPDFALNFIEQIKHLFSVKGITFLLVLNRNQLGEFIKARYGNGVVATLYLQKFINIWLSLPRKKEKNLDNGAQYLHYALSKMIVNGEPLPNQITKNTLEELVILNRSSYREIERILSYFAIIHNMGNSNTYIPQYQYLMAFVCFIKCVNPDLLTKVVNGTVGPDELLAETNLCLHEKESDLRRLSELVLFIRYDLSSASERKSLIESNYIAIQRVSYGSHSVMVDISNWLSEINIEN